MTRFLLFVLIFLPFVASVSVQADAGEKPETVEAKPVANEPVAVAPDKPAATETTETASAKPAAGGATAEPRNLPAAAKAAASAPEDAPESQTTPTPRTKSAPGKAKLKTLIDDAAKQYGVERALVHAVVAAESAYNAHAVSHAGAIGVMQVMPETAKDYGVASAQALFEPNVNIKTGTRHLSRLLAKYKNDYGRAIMAYNAGEGVVDRTNSNVTYTETLNYTEAVIRNYRRNGGKQPTEAALKKVRALRKISHSGKARRLMKKYLDPSLLSLKVRPTLSTRYLDPSLHNPLPERKHMFVLESPKKN